MRVSECFGWCLMVWPSKKRQGLQSGYSYKSGSDTIKSRVGDEPSEDWLPRVQDVSSTGSKGFEIWFLGSPSSTFPVFLWLKWEVFMNGWP